jgi:hypothetical protein
MLGNVILISSGETAQTGGLVFRKLSASLPRGYRIALLETPAGFETNSSKVAQKVADAIALRTKDFEPRIDVIPARRRDSPFGTNSPEVLGPLPAADVLYMGAGSPTYAVRHLRGSLAWQELLAGWQQGTWVVFASAAAVAAGRYTLPVYEIFKAGDDPEWKPGLDLFGILGWTLAVVSHWNNAEGGEEMDTSRCFIGRERFDALLRQLPSDAVVLGLDEHTALTFDWRSGRAAVDGKGTITILRNGRERTYPAGEEFPLDALGDYHIPSEPIGVERAVWEDVRACRAEVEAEPAAPAEVLALLHDRERLRKDGDYARADLLRREIERRGWKIMDTRSGAVLRPMEKG